MSFRDYLAGFRPPVDESVLTELAGDRLFWPAFLLSVGGSTSAATAFDEDPADIEEYAGHLHHPDSWPFLTVRLARGHRLHILFRNFDGDASWDYLFQPAGSDALLVLAALEGHFRGPAFSWPELLTAAELPDPDRSRAERLLLLLPAVGDPALPPDATSLIAEAFIAVGGQPERGHEVAHELLAASGRFWGPHGPHLPPGHRALPADALRA